MRLDTKKNAILLVGTLPTRPFVLREAVRTADAVGADIYLVDNPQHRNLSRALIADSHFLSAPIHRAEDADGTAAGIVEFAANGNIAFDAAYTAFDAYVEIAARISELIGANGNTVQAVTTAHQKHLMRTRLARDTDLYTPFAVAHTRAEARTFLAELGGPLVIKPLRGAGSRGVLTGIKTERDLFNAWRHVPKGTAVLLERELEGQEVDVEIVRQNGQLIFAAVADNPEISLPDKVETGTTYPSQLPHEDQEMLIRAAERVLTLLGLGDGNFHIEMVLTADGPRIVEVNARMGGAFVFDAIRAAYGVNLVDLGLRALLSEPITAVSGGARTVVEACFFIPAATGTLTQVAGLKELEQVRGFAGMRLWKSLGQTVLAPANDPADYLGFALFTGENAAAARQNALVALAGLRFSIRDDDGCTLLTDASFMHAGSDYVLPTSK